MSRGLERSPVAVAAFLIIVALALADGGASPAAVGALAAVVWVAVVVSVLLKRETGGLTPGVAGIAAALLGLLALTLLSLSWTRDDGAAFLDAVRLSGYLGIVVLAAVNLRPGDGSRILPAIPLAALVIALVALAARLAGIGGGDRELAELVPLAAGRLSFPLGYWNALGALMALAIPALVHLAGAADSRRAGLWVAAGVPMILTAYMAQSRGALLAALIGAGVAIAASSDRRRPTVSLAVMIVAALPACIAASFASGIRDSAGDGTPGGPEALVAVLLLAGVALAWAAGRRLLSRVDSSSPGSGRVRLPAAVVVPALVLGVAVVIGLAGGPGVLVDEFNTLPADPRTSDATGLLSASGSGRAQFWETALDAFAEDPMRGIGAGSFATYWNRNGSLGTPVRDVHSAPLEYLAELGLIAPLLFLAIFAIAAVVGRRRARGPGGDAAAAALGILAAGLVGYAIDFTWQIPAVTFVMLLVAVALAGRAFGAEDEGGTAWLPAPLLAAGAIPLAALSVWAGGVLAIADTKLTESREELAAGDASGAAAAARDAIAVEPWAAEPWLQLADIEQSVDNLSAARRAALEAIERSPDDFRVWLLLSVVEASDGQEEAAALHTVRSIELAPRVLQRLPEFVPSGS